MRLGQMARRLGVTPAEIIRYLSEVNIHVEESTNTRLDDVHIPLLYARFAPAEIPDTSTEELPAAVPAADTRDDVTEHVDAPVPVGEPLPAGETVPEASTEPDLIRAPKIELSGLKVLGKITLPESRKKEAPLAQQGDEQLEQRKENSPAARKNHAREQRPRKNPIAAQREREMLEEQERRKAKLAQEKERRTQNYHKRVKHSPPTKAARLVDEPLEELSASMVDEAPRSWFGKLIHWLRT